MFKKFSNSLPKNADRAPESNEKFRFLDALMGCGVVAESCEQLGYKKSTVFQWRRDDEAFAERWDRIMRSHTTAHLESEAVRRALAGSDVLLIFLLKAADRKRYDDNVARNTQEKPSITITMVNADETHIAGDNGPNGGSPGSTKAG